MKRKVDTAQKTVQCSDNNGEYLFDLKNGLSLLPILTVKLTFACVPAAEGDQCDDTDKQDTASTHCSTNNYQHRQGFCKRNIHKRKVWWGEGVVGSEEIGKD